MSKARSPRTKTAAKPRATRRAKRSIWVRKSVVVDQRKLDVAMRVFGVTTAKEAIDQALDNIVFSEEFAKGMDAIRRSGGLRDIDDVLKGR
jgi:Arc/MetJ family transcription regulator